MQKIYFLLVTLYLLLFTSCDQYEPTNEKALQIPVPMVDLEGICTTIFNDMDMDGPRLDEVSSENFACTICLDTSNHVVVWYVDESGCDVQFTRELWLEGETFVYQVTTSSSSSGSNCDGRYSMNLALVPLEFDDMKITKENLIGRVIRE